MSIYINRSYEKIDSILSYIGGLFGSIIAVLIIFSIYDNYSYEISIGSLLFKLDEKRYKFKKYNIFYFILHLFYKLFRSKL